MSLLAVSVGVHLANERGDLTGQGIVAAQPDVPAVGVKDQPRSRESAFQAEVMSLGAARRIAPLIPNATTATPASANRDLRRPTRRMATPL